MDSKIMFLVVAQSKKVWDTLEMIYGVQGLGFKFYGTIMFLDVEILKKYGTPLK